MLRSSPYWPGSALNGENASTLLAALVTGLAPLLLPVFSAESAEDAVDESDPDGLCLLFDRCSSWTGLGTGGASSSL